ncbi:phage terminase small subunit [uncultured Megamonas sp.]|uniref:phage terminase small subunit n=1 Tax=uncultured Megamonas sp. TaxID=286140 RepID=UPI00259B89F7|nr:phage terminase small subunit [uncultured Megamonas sp.]
MAYDEKIKKKVQILYEKGTTFKEISEQYKISAKTVRQWASKYKWVRQKGSKKSTETKRKASGVCIGKLQNTNAVKHGLFSKYLPAETLELVGNIEMMSPLDILWENICLKYAAIIRSQQIMYVKDSNDVTKRITVDGSETTVYQYKEAYEKQASFLMAQSRAMGTLMNLIKRYEEMCNSELATEEQKLRIEKLKKEIAKDNTQETLMEDDGFTKAIENATKEVWRDD